MINETFLVKDSLSWETRREYYEKHKGALGIVIAITVLSPFLGLVLAGPIGVALGLALGFLAYFLGPKAVTKVIEKTKGHA
jgi:ABC-type phosphate transport system permease subunit